MPERRSRLIPAIRSKDAALLTSEAPPPGEPPQRPLSLLDPPEEIEALAEIPDGAPLHFRWRRVLHRVARAEGPERIAPEWWREETNVRARDTAPGKAKASDAAKTRDYYRIEDAAGRRFWLYREGLYDGGRELPRWYMHGLFA